jgi:hypothetical protein
MAKNASLRKADAAKQDEFYTQLVDIEREMRHYREQFRGKVILCNCDDPYESNFFKYFAMNFNFLSPKKLIATCYTGSPIAGSQLTLFDIIELDEKPDDGKRPYKIEITEVIDANADGAIDLADVEFLLKNKRNALTLLQGDGDFRSSECVGLLQQADIVVTNPPFSLFRQYVAQLLQYGKKFVILANQNVLTYKEIFPLLKDNIMWLGYYSGDMAFTVPANYEERSTRFWVDENGQKWRSMGNICWFTNLDTTKRHEFLTLYKHYTPQEYPHYDNYDAINVNKTSDIPLDYDGAMGVPITFVDKYNPEQFEIIDGIGRYSVLNNEETRKAGNYLSMIDGKAQYFRYIIQHKK